MQRYIRSDARTSILNPSAAARVVVVLVAATLSILAAGGLALAFPSGPAATIATYSSGFSTPAGVASDSGGNLYVAGDTNCDLIQVKANLSKVTLAPGPCGTSPLLNHPGGIAVNATTVFIADTANCLVRSVPIAGGPLTTVAGNGTCGYSGDSGPATSAKLNSPSGVAVDGSGNLFIADTTNCRVREVSGGTITTFAGTGTCSPSVGAPGTAIGGVTIGPPVDVAVNGTTVYAITGAMGGVCQEFGTDGVVVKAPIFNDSSCLTLSGNHVAVSATGSVYADFADSASTCEAKAIVANNSAKTVAGMPTCGYMGDLGPATSAEIGSMPGALAVDGAGNVYISDTANNVVRIVYAPVLPPSVGGIAEIPDAGALGAQTDVTSGGHQAGLFGAAGAIAFMIAVTLCGAWVAHRRWHRDRGGAA
ncbi:MAG TPA: hypothetical protein VEZ14_08600 [Dehalococcoidia bacterium]|nr:hypothetical protein [Dehalococcoidia bacterium]